MVIETFQKSLLSGSYFYVITRIKTFNKFITFICKIFKLFLLQYNNYALTLPPNLPVRRHYD